MPGNGAAGLMTGGCGGPCVARRSRQCRHSGMHERSGAALHRSGADLLSSSLLSSAAIGSTSLAGRGAHHLNAGGGWSGRPMLRPRSRRRRRRRRRRPATRQMRARVVSTAATAANIYRPAEPLRLPTRPFIIDTASDTSIGAALLLPPRRRVRGAARLLLPPQLVWDCLPAEEGGWPVLSCPVLSACGGGGGRLCETVLSCPVGLWWWSRGMKCLALMAALLRREDGLSCPVLSCPAVVVVGMECVRLMAARRSDASPG